LRPVVVAVSVIALGLVKAVLAVPTVSVVWAVTQTPRQPPAKGPRVMPPPRVTGAEPGRLFRVGLALAGRRIQIGADGRTGIAGLDAHQGGDLVDQEQASSVRLAGCGRASAGEGVGEAAAVVNLEHHMVVFGPNLDPSCSCSMEHGVGGQLQVQKGHLAQAVRAGLVHREGAGLREGIGPESP
jgi:hypothetical protein